MSKQRTVYDTRTCATRVSALEAGASLVEEESEEDGTAVVVSSFESGDESSISPESPDDPEPPLTPPSGEGSGVSVDLVASVLPSGGRPCSALNFARAASCFI